MRPAITWLLCCLGVAVHAQSGLSPLPPDLPSRYGVVGVRAHAVAGSLQVTKIRLHSPAQRCGLRNGDRILGAGGFRLASVDELGRLVQSIAPDDSVTFNLRRGTMALEATCAVTDRLRLFGLMTEGAQAEPSTAARHADWHRKTRQHERRAIRLISDHGASDVLDTLARSLDQELARYGRDGRLADVAYLLRHPLKMPAAGRTIERAFSAGQSLREHLSAAATHLDLQIDKAPKMPQAPTEFSLQTLLLDPVHQATLGARQAFGDLSATQRSQLRDGIAPLLQRLDRSFFLDEGDSSETEAHVHTLRLAKRVDVAALVQAARQLSRLAQPSWLKRLAAAVRELPAREPAAIPGISGDLLYAEHTDLGWIVVGDTTANVYAATAAVIVDLGGDDIYLAGPGTATSTSPVGVVLDLAGNDRYVGNTDGTLGAGLAGIGLLVDQSGDDTYSGGTLTQGAAFCGVGMLLDMAGNDTYLAQHSSQGAGFFGVGLLVDDRGDDLTSIGQFGQGFGGAHGAGLLLDGGGNDRYVADLKKPSSYGTAGAYSGWAQGMGMGFRGFTAGGLGLLASAGDGDDSYQAGDFSQGTGYFFGLGVLADSGGDDTYLGTRYAQGAAAHQAVGILLDGAGSDRYSGTVAANQGAAWDAAAAVLVDGGGDDHYTAGGLAQGAAAMNGVGWLADRSGDDIYETVSGQGDGGSTRYWGGRGALNLGVLIDTGGRDSYSRPDRTDGADLRASQVGLFRDTKPGPKSGPRSR